MNVQYIPRNMHTVFALLCFVVVIHWLIFPYPSGLLHWHCGNLKIAPVPAKQPWWIWINTSCELIMNDCITTTKQSTTKPCAYFLGYTVCSSWIIKITFCTKLLFINRLYIHICISWWCHQMEIFSALLALCVRNSPVTGEFPSQRPVTRSFDAFLPAPWIKRLSKNSCGWWLQTPSRSLWRRGNVGLCTTRQFYVLPGWFAWYIYHKNAKCLRFRIRKQIEWPVKTRTCHHC